MPEQNPIWEIISSRRWSSASAAPPRAAFPARRVPRAVLQAPPRSLDRPLELILRRHVVAGREDDRSRNSLIRVPRRGRRGGSGRSVLVVLDPKDLLLLVRGNSSTASPRTRNVPRWKSTSLRSYCSRSGAAGARCGGTPACLDADVIRRNTPGTRGRRCTTRSDHDHVAAGHHDLVALCASCRSAR